MLSTPSERIHECLTHAEECARKAAAQTNPILEQDFLDLEWRWLALATSYHSRQHLSDFADLLGRTRWLIDESRLLQAIIRNEKISDTKLLTNCRVEIVESKHLLARVDSLAVIARNDTAHAEPARIGISATELSSSEETDHNPAILTINVFQEEGRFGWTVHRRATKEVLGRGAAQTELKARADAFGAGMTFIERLMGQPTPADNSLH